MDTKATRLYATRHDIPEDARAELINVLNQHLADLADLHSQAKQAHWNVKGMAFFSLHTLFDQLADGVLGFVDMVAERVTALGGDAIGTVRMAAANSRLQEFPADLSDGRGFVEAMIDRYSAYAAYVRDAIEVAEDLGDMDTADLFTEVSREIDKNLYFLEAHLR